MTPESGNKFVYLIGFVVIAIAVTGYFTGLQSPMNPSDSLGESDSPVRIPRTELASNSLSLKSPSVETILATHYSEMPNAMIQKKSKYRTSLADLKRDFDSLAEIKITPEQKKFALAIRDQNRAFNGAPPTIPHSIEQMSAESCMACHGEGFKSETLRISKMSHQFLTNCTQCHVENNPKHMAATLFRENTFVGLPAPDGGPRAYAGAPPIIPHSTWMRVNCLSCHGFASEQGVRTTHPWRQNCQQCHAPSSELDQVLLDHEPRFLPPPNVVR